MNQPRQNRWGFFFGSNFTHGIILAILISRITFDPLTYSRVILADFSAYEQKP